MAGGWISTDGADKSLILGLARPPEEADSPLGAAPHPASCGPTQAACSMSPMCSPVSALASRANQYNRPIIINIDGIAMIG